MAALLLCAAAPVLSFVPGLAPSLSAPVAAPVAVRMLAEPQGLTTRRGALAALAAAAVPALPAFAMVPPEGYKLEKDYPKDARKMLDNMVKATELARGAPGMEDQVKATRSEMNDFVAFYRRQPKVAGMPSSSTLYTAINTLSGHYASYGNKYPVPTKRKERLTQQYKEIERALARGK